MAVFNLWVNTDEETIDMDRGKQREYLLAKNEDNYEKIKSKTGKFFKLGDSRDEDNLLFRQYVKKKW